MYLENQVAMLYSVLQWVYRVVGSSKLSSSFHCKVTVFPLIRALYAYLVSKLKLRRLTDVGAYFKKNCPLHLFK